MPADYELRRAEFQISTRRERLDRGVILGFLREAYWARDLPEEAITRSIAGALPFGLYHDTDGQVGFARVVTDYARFGFLSDVFVLEAYRGRGLGVWLVDSILRHPDLQTLTRWHLGTSDAHGLYSRFGFQQADPQRYMNLVRSSWLGKR